jgi:hypothetical protein
MRRSSKIFRRPVLIGAVACVLLGTAAWWIQRPQGHQSSVLEGVDLGDGYWKTPLAPDAPVDPRSDEFIHWLESDNEPDHLLLAGATSSGRWGLPMFESDEGDPAYAIKNNCGFVQPPEFSSVRIPSTARPDDSSDSEMSIYDVDKGIVYGLFRASYSEEEGEWQACGGTVYYLESNGLDGDLQQTDEPRNFGHRGLPSYVYAVRYDEIEDGAINHVLKVAVNTAKVEHVFPMTGSDGNSTDPLAPPEGARIRLKPEIDLSAMDLTRAERIVATALQRYGAVIGDQSGGGVVLKLENTVAEDRGNLWEGVLHKESLEDFNLEDFEVIELGYTP